MSKNKIGEDSPIPKFIYLKIQRWDGVESLTTLEEGEFKVPIDGCIKSKRTSVFLASNHGPSWNVMHKMVCYILKSVITHSCFLLSYCLSSAALLCSPNGALYLVSLLFPSCTGSLSRSLSPPANQRVPACVGAGDSRVGGRYPICHATIAKSPSLTVSIKPCFGVILPVTQYCHWYDKTLHFMSFFVENYFFSFSFFSCQWVRFCTTELCMLVSLQKCPTLNLVTYMTCSLVLTAMNVFILSWTFHYFEIQGFVISATKCIAFCSMCISVVRKTTLMLW